MTLTKPTDRQTYQYANYLKKVGKFKIKLWTPSFDVEPFLVIVDRLGWKISSVGAISLGNTVRIRKDTWDSRDPIKRVGLLNHESKHIGQIKRVGDWRSKYLYISDPKWRYKAELEARIRNLETYHMFGKKITNRYIAGCAKALKTTYLLGNAEQRDMRRVLTIVRSRLEAGTHRSDSIIFWSNFLKTTKKRSLVLK